MKKFKLAISVIAVLMCFGAFSMTAYADDPVTGDVSDISSAPEVPNDVSDIGGDDTSSDTGGDIVSSDIIDEPTAPDISEPDIPDDSYSSSYTVEDPTYSGDEYNNGDDDYYYGDDYYASSYDGTDYYSSYVGGGQTYVVPESTAPPAALYDVTGRVDGKELNSSDWDDIAESLKNASADDGGDDFSFIQKNNSNFDNGEWMLFAGIACLVLSVAGIVYVIISSAKARRKFSFANNGKQAVAAVSGSDAYGDGYSGSSGSKKSDKSKFDTAEVKLNKNKGGKRYK